MQVRYDVLPAPPRVLAIVDRNACPSSTDFSDLAPALGPGNYLVVSYEPGFPHGRETGRAAFTLH